MNATVSIRKSEHVAIEIESRMSEPSLKMRSVIYASTFNQHIGTRRSLHPLTSKSLLLTRLC